MWSASTSVYFIINYPFDGLHMLRVGFFSVSFFQFSFVRLLRSVDLLLILVVPVRVHGSRAAAAAAAAAVARPNVLFLLSAAVY